jgi:outer membrane protein assembly factor BamE
MRSFVVSLGLLLALGLGGCSSLGNLVYKIDIPQGNYLEQDQVDKLRVGMTPEQVQFVLGSPMLVDSFNPNRWVYVYSFKPGKGQAEQHQLVLNFSESQQLAYLSGDFQSSRDFHIPLQ